MTLALSYHDLRAAVGVHAGFGRDPDSATDPWDDEKKGAVDDAINAGYRWFLFPAQAGMPSHSWSFLAPIGRVVTVSGVATYQLPADFGHPGGDLTLVSASVPYDTVALVGEKQLAQCRSGNPTSSGIPRMAAVRPLRGGGGPQRWELEVYPSPDAEYAMDFPYTVGDPGKLSDQNEHPYGGAMHAETLKAACLAAWEVQHDDERGPQWEKFQQNLLASVQADSRTRGNYLGRYRDESGPMGGGSGRERHDNVYTFTVNGVEPT